MKFKETDIEVKALTRKQVKQLRADGVDPFGFSGEKALQGDMDAVLDVVYPGVDAVDELEYPEAVALYREVVDASLGKGEEAKN